MPTLVKKGEFAKIKGWSPSYVTKLIGLDRVVLSPDGKKIDVEASELKLAGTADAVKEGLRQHHARERLNKGAFVGDAPGDGIHPRESSTLDWAAGEQSGGPIQALPAKSASDANYDRYNAARAISEEERSKLAGIERRRREGELVETVSVRKAAERIGELISNGLQTMRPRLVPLLAAETDPLKVDELLKQELAKLLTDLADESMKLVGASINA